MEETIVLSSRSAMSGSNNSGKRRVQAWDVGSGFGLWAVVSRLIWSGRPDETLSDHLLDDIGVSRFDLDTLAP